jgi:hypothetical protein
MKRCTVPGCGLAHYARGFCRSHYERWRVHGDPFAHVPIGRWRSHLAVDRAEHGPHVCVCRVSRPRGEAWAARACQDCGYPCVHLMSLANCRWALERWPFLAVQVVHARGEEVMPIGS